MLVVKLDKDKTDGDTPEKMFVSVKRLDGGWESDKAEVTSSGDIIDLKLRSGKPNLFEIVISDNTGEILSCEPNEITILQGVKSGSATLAYSYGLELLGTNDKANFYYFSFLIHSYKILLLPRLFLCLTWSLIIFLM